MIPISTVTALYVISVVAILGGITMIVMRDNCKLGIVFAKITGYVEIVSGIMVFLFAHFVLYDMMPGAH